MKTKSFEHPKVPVTINDALRAVLQAHDKLLAEAVAAFSKSSSTYEGLQAEVERLTQEIESTADSVDPMDASAVQTLETKRSQLKIASQRLSGLETGASNQISAILAVLEETQNLVARALNANVDRHIERIGTELRPYFTQESEARHAAASTGFVRQYRGFIQRRFERFPGEFLKSAKEATRVIRQILAGEEPFTFNPGE